MATINFIGKLRKLKENGYEERDAILSHLETLDDRAFSVLACRWSNRRSDPPMPIFIWKER